MPKKEPKYYQYKTQYAEISPAQRKKYLSAAVGNRDFIAIGRSINYSAERIRSAFRYPGAKITQPVWDAIVKYLDSLAEIPKKAKSEPPVKKKGESAIDFAARKNAWKKSSL